MKTFKRILFLVAVLSSSVLIASFSSGGDTPDADFREIDMRFTILSGFGSSSLGDDLTPNFYNPVKEPNHFDFQPFGGQGSTSMDVFKILREEPYGWNTYGDATYYYMHGRRGGWDCLDKDNVTNAVDPNDRSVVFLDIDISVPQEVWAQIMSQCHSTDHSGVDAPGRGFWYKHQENYSTVALMTAATEGIDLDFLSKSITNCIDYPSRQYGCDPGIDEGYECEGC